MAQAAAAVDLSQEFLQFVQRRAREARADDVPPASLDDWKAQRTALRERLITSWGGFPSEHCPLEPRIVGEFQRDGYRVEKILLQTRPGVWMTANAYVPDGGGRRAAVLCVHGHWREAKQHPVVQSRCIGLAKLGFFVLAVDAFGAGERGIGKALGEYHGEMVAGTLLPTGLVLAGLQVYENMRAVDYLQSRPEVDPEQIGVTGASGGGNQSMYVGAIDERLKGVVPVCSVGTYQAYLGVACCMCEVTPGALSYTEEAGVLALVAPRGLMVVNATRDGIQFSVGEAAKSIAAAKPVFSLYGVEDHIRHAVFESGHDYNQPMREAMYGWMTKHLKGEGDGSPIAEPELVPEDPETLRCFPGDSRPDDFVTLPRFAAREARRILKSFPIPNHAEHWRTQEMSLLMALPQVLGGLPEGTGIETTVTEDAETGTTEFRFQPEPGVTVLVRRIPAAEGEQGTALLLDLDQGRDASESELAKALQRQGWNVVTADLRATGATAWPRERIGRAPDHNTAEWSLWLGRPLLGQWTWDVLQLINVMNRRAGRRQPPDLSSGEQSSPTRVALIGSGPAGLIALCAAALTTRIDVTATVGTLSSYVSDAPYEQQRLGTLVPGMLRDMGDVAHLAATISPRRLVIANGVNGQGTPLSADDLQLSSRYTSAAYRLEDAAEQLRILADADVKTIVSNLS